MISFRNNSLGFLFFISLLFGNFDKFFCEFLEEKMKADPDISQFYSFLEQCKICNNTLESEEVTVFAPINAAFQKILKKNSDTNSMVLYHIINIPKKTEELGVSHSYLPSRLGGSPPLWITHSSGKHFNDIYINNAKILLNQSNVIGTRGSLEQVMHKIDEVLIPTRSIPTSSVIYNPSAWDFLNNYGSLIQGTHRIRNFQQRVEQNHKEDIFQSEGSYTFFIPVDEGFENSRANLIDAKIIDGHVIPKQVLFTTPTRKDVPFQTLASGDNDIRVVVSFTQEQRGNLLINYVKSHTLFSDGKHARGVVLAEIVKANIPVKNGVIHLIHKPLMVVDSNVRQMLEEHMDYICRVGNVQRMENVIKEQLPPERPEFPNGFPMLPNEYDYNDDFLQYKEKDSGLLNNFVNAINTLGKTGEDFLRTIEKSHEVTLFAPCNAAWDENFDDITRDKQKLLEILKLHVVVDNVLYVDVVERKNHHKIYQAPTMVKGKNLYFNVVTKGLNRTMTVDGDGVNATVIQSDLAAKNGIIHIIDRVLGVPYTTVLDKLRTDPMLSDTYYLGSLQGFNDQLNDRTKLFTYFVPRNKAWAHAKVIMPSSIKALFMKDYAYHATNTLQRHLIIADELYTMERIKQISILNTTNNPYLPSLPSAELRTVRGSLKLYIEEKLETKTNISDTVNASSKRNLGSAYYIHWNEEKIPVFRPNIKCTNGIIHVIDAPFLTKGDIRISFATNLQPSTALFFSISVSTIIAFILK